MISQNQMEHLLHKKHITFKLMNELQTDLPELIGQGIELLKQYLDTPMWASAERRKDSIKLFDKESVVLDIVTTVTLACQQGLPLVSIASMLTLTNDLEKLDNIQLSADLLALFKDIGAYTITQSVGGTYVVLSSILPSEPLERQIKLGCYLPPMVERPKTLYTNTDSGYKTVNRDSLILKGKNNEHSGCISLDVLNLMNRNEYELDEHIIAMTKPWYRDKLSALELSLLTFKEGEEYRNSVLTYESYLEQFNYLKEILKGRSIYFTHKVDKRGRIYCQGYHFNTQGTGYEKASLNLKHKELITGEL